jgi:hypothetical protein
MDQVWREAPVPAVRVRASVEASAWEANAAARQWMLLHEIRDDELTSRLAELRDAGDADRLFGAQGQWRVRCRVVPLDNGRLI